MKTGDMVRIKQSMFPIRSQLRATRGPGIVIESCASGGGLIYTVLWGNSDTHNYSHGELEVINESR